MTPDLRNNSEPLLRLIQILKDDPVINNKVVTILKLDSFNRRTVLNNWLDQLRGKNASEKLMQGLSCLFDDAIAKKTLSLISKSK